MEVPEKDGFEEDQDDDEFEEIGEEDLGDNNESGFE